MLNQETNTQTTEIATVAPASVPTTTQPTQIQSFSQLVGRFQREMGFAVLPAESATGCTVINGGIKFGANMEQDAGDYLIINPQNVTVYKKLDLGIPNPTQDEKKFQVNSYDGQKVSFDEQEYTVNEFLELVRSKGYSKASWKERAVLHGLYVDCDRADKVKLGEDDNLFAVYLSPSSLKSWAAFLTKSTLHGGFGYIKLTKVAKSWNGVNWMQFGFGRVNPNELALAA